VRSEAACRPHCRASRAVRSVRLAAHRTHESQERRLQIAVSYRRTPPRPSRAPRLSARLAHEIARELLDCLERSAVQARRASSAVCRIHELRPAGAREVPRRRSVQARGVAASLPRAEPTGRRARRGRRQRTRPWVRRQLTAREMVGSMEAAGEPSPGQCLRNVATRRSSQERHRMPVAVRPSSVRPVRAAPSPWLGLS